MASVAREDQNKSRLGSGISTLLAHLPGFRDVPELNPKPGISDKVASELTTIRSFYEIRDASDTERLLLENAAVRRVVLEAVQAIPEYFPSFEKSTIRFREAGEDRPNPYLTVRIDTGRSAEDARSLRERFESEWLVPRFAAVYPNLLIDVEYNAVAI